MIEQKLADSLNWTLLHVLIVIYEEGSVSAAANRLKYYPIGSQSKPQKVRRKD